jgi:hypothetical protein
MSRKLDESMDEEWEKHNTIRFVRDCPQLNTNFEKQKIILRDARQTGHGRSLEREQQWTVNQKDLALVLDSELEAATRYRQKFQVLVRVETFLGLMTVCPAI